MSRIAWKGVMDLPQQVSEGVIPDLQKISLKELEKLDGTVLAHSIDQYRERLRENGVLFNEFNNLAPSDESIADPADGADNLNDRARIEAYSP
jgi:hypothetical protein